MDTVSCVPRVNAGCTWRRGDIRHQALAVCLGFLWTSDKSQFSDRSFLSGRSNLWLLSCCRATVLCRAATPLPSSLRASRLPVLGPEQSPATSAGSSSLWLTGNAALPRRSCWCLHTRVCICISRGAGLETLTLRVQIPIHATEGYSSGFPGCLVNTPQLETFLGVGLSLCEGSTLARPGELAAPPGDLPGLAGLLPARGGLQPSLLAVKATCS